MVQDGERSTKDGDQREAFERAAARDSGGILGEYVSFLRHSRKWWLVPILVFLVAVGGFLVLGSTTLAPLIYALF